MDANHHCVEVCYVRTWLNESKYAWDILNWFTRKVIPHFVTDGRVDITDLSKGAETSHIQYNGDCKHLFDHYHLVQILRKKPRAQGGGAENVAAYIAAFNATTLADLARIESEFSPELTNYLASVTRRGAVLYPIKAGLGSVRHGSGIEGNNASTKLNLRKVHMTHFFTQCVRTVVPRALRHKKAAFHWYPQTPQTAFALWSPPQPKRTQSFFPPHLLKKGGLNNILHGTQWRILDNMMELSHDSMFHKRT